MSDDTLHVWIFDDERRERVRAAQCVREIFEALPETAQISLYEELKWPNPPERLPDIVVLDLVDEFGLSGIDVYRKLRDIELPASTLPAPLSAEPALIVLWTADTAGAHHDKALRQAIASDLYLIACPRKTLNALEDALLIAIERRLERFR